MVVERVVVLGRGGAGKSTLAVRLGQLVGLPVIELDTHFWSPDLQSLAAEAWSARLHELAGAPRWVMDGDLGPYDVLGPRLSRADTVVMLDLSLFRCAWRIMHRSSERADFWWWVLAWRYRSRPVVLRAVATYAPQADLYVLRNPRQVRAFFGDMG